MDFPVCRNRMCPKYHSNSEVIILKYGDADVTFGCKACGGIHVRTTNHRRGEQALDYQRHGRPEYARDRAFFFQGKHHGLIER